MSRKRQNDFNDFNSLFGAPINLKKNQQKLVVNDSSNGNVKKKKNKDKQKNKENVDVSDDKVTFELTPLSP